MERCTFGPKPELLPTFCHVFIFLPLSFFDLFRLVFLEPDSDDVQCWLVIKTKQNREKKKDFMVLIQISKLDMIHICSLGVQPGHSFVI